MNRFSSADGLVLLGLTILGAAGCGGGGSAPPVETFPVQGKVIFKNNALPVSRLELGKIWFQSTSDPKLEAVGSIADDGSFIMTTLFPEKGFSGVPAGKYKVRLEPPPDDEERRPQTDLIHPKYLDYDKSGLAFTVPVPGEITIEVERPGR